MKIKKNIGSLLLLISVGHVLFAQNYDEKSIPPYTLPALMQSQDGKVITSKKEWEKDRRPELLKLFEDHEYGQVPQDFDNIQFEVVNEDKGALDGKATLKEVSIIVKRKQKSVTINLVMFTPNDSKKPVPTFLVINHRGMKTMDITRENKDDFWPAEEVIAGGYGIAGFDVIDVAPDDEETFDQGILQLYPEQLEMKNGMRALGAWGWGASRAIDYFEKDKSVDAKKVITVGHSRGGKASLWCGAQDQRVAIAISNESGNSGASLSRRNYGETIKDIIRFTHWFCPNYAQYVDNEDKLPFDQHMLLALMAPRAVYVSAAEEDLWADPKGQYLSMLEAQDAFNLYGIETDLPKEMPAVNLQVVQPHMGYHNRSGKHNMILYDWQQFMKFADQYFEK